MNALYPSFCRSPGQGHGYGSGSGSCSCQASTIGVLAAFAALAGLLVNIIAQNAAAGADRSLSGAGRSLSGAGRSLSGAGGDSDIESGGWSKGGDNAQLLNELQGETTMQDYM